MSGRNRVGDDGRCVLPAHHRDPFDRLLVAQAQLDDLAILTADPLFTAYDVATIAAAP